jgi:hypothetical protein
MHIIDVSMQYYTHIARFTLRYVKNFKQKCNEN